MSYHDTVVGLGMCHQPIVGDLQERRNRCGFIGLSGSPRANLSQGGKNRVVGRQEESFALSMCPVGKRITTADEFIADLLDAGDDPGRVLSGQPFPEGRTEVETIMQVLGLDEYVRVEEVTGQAKTPTSCPM